MKSSKPRRQYVPVKPIDAVATGVKAGLRGEDWIERLAREILSKIPEAPDEPEARAARLWAARALDPKALSPGTSIVNAAIHADRFGLEMEELKTARDYAADSTRVRNEKRAAFWGNPYLEAAHAKHQDLGATSLAVAARKLALSGVKAQEGEQGDQEGWKLRPVDDPKKRGEIDAPRARAFLRARRKPEATPAK